jgi:hypothetical protein
MRSFKNEMSYGKNNRKLYKNGDDLKLGAAKSLIYQDNGKNAAIIKNTKNLGERFR